MQIGTPEEILTNPANEYVEHFVEDVDLSKVLTAAHVMKRPITMTPDRGPRVALAIYERTRRFQCVSGGRIQKLLGAVVAEDASEAVKSGKKIE